MKLIGERILIKVVERPQKTEGGIYIPDNVNKKTKEGIVIDHSPKFRVPLGLRVLYNEFAGTETPDGLILRKQDIVCIDDKAPDECLILEKVKDDDFTKGIIIHPDHKFKKAIVFSVGDGQDYQIERGDKIYYNNYADAGYHFEVDGKVCLLIRKQDIYGFPNTENHKEWQ